jgi:hypothetical protein
MGKFYSLTVLMGGRASARAENIDMAKLYRFWYTFAMTYYDRIFEEAIGNYGLITSSQAKAIGIPSVELVKLAQRGRLTRLGYGVYKLAQYSPAPDGRDAYADSLALVDKDAYLYGQSVLALHHLCPTNPARIYVATPRRIRKKLDKGIQVIDSTPCKELEWYEGLPSQSISLAIRTARGTIMDERLREAIKTARQKDLIDD